MPAHNCELNDPQTILRILLSLVLENSGELRIPATTFDSIDRGRLLTVDYDKKKGHIVLRSTSDFGRAVVVQPESQSWTMPPNLAPTERSRLQAERATEKRAIPSDEELARMEEKIQRQQSLALDLEEGKSPMRINIRK